MNVRTTWLVPVRSELQLRIALHAMTMLAAAEIAAGGLPPLYSSGVRYRREPRGCEVWKTPSVALKAGWGDCDTLAPWRAAEVGGIAWPVRVSTGWHVVVIRPDGAVEDPSKALGMGVDDDPRGTACAMWGALS